ncbi:MAG: pyridoxal phosphate-dependent aminotransferase [Myxococcales bacterium]
MTPIPLCRPTVGPEELAAVGDVLASGHLVQGARVAAFEEALATRLGQPVAATSSGTAALHLALLALGVGPGDEVIVPGVTFPAPANAVEAVGARAVAADVDPERWALDPARAAAAMSARTRAVIVVHPFGVPADVPALRSLGVPIIEDAACALGATLDGRPCGTLGDVACFSFHPRKVITTGEGGALTSPDAGIVDRARRLRNHGMGPATGGDPGARFEEVGLNLRLSDVHAAVGVVQLRRLDALIDERAALAERARSFPLALLPGLFAPGAVVQSLVGLLPPGVDRAAVLAALAPRAEATVASYAIHRLAPWRGRPWATDAALPMAARIHDSGVTLPLWPGMGPDAIDEVGAALRDALLTTTGGEP